MGIYKYTPDLMSQKDLEKLSVERGEFLPKILKRIVDHGIKKIPAYFLVVGPRGVGKSHLLLTLYYRITSDPNLSNILHPIKLAEEEYSIHRVSDLLLRILQEEGVVVKTTKEDAIIQQGILYLRDVKKKKMPILLIDNLNLVFGQLSDEHLRKLRSILQEENFLIIVATAPSILNEVSNYEKPFYNFFEIMPLGDLTEDEVEKLVKKKLEFEGKTDLVLKFDQLKPRLKSLSVITGGNPRLLLMMCDLVCKSEKIPDIEIALLDLLDELTPFYQAKMERFSSQQRIIFDTLALADRPLTPTEIAKRTGIEARAVIVQLKRLSTSGYVERIKLKRKKTTRYEIKERLFRIWREMRSSPIGSKRLHLFAIFLRLWYEPQELAKNYEELMTIMEKGTEKERSEEIHTAAIHAYYLQEALGNTVRRNVIKKNIFLDWVERCVQSGEFEIVEKEIEKRKRVATKNRRRNEMAVIFAATGILNESKGLEDKALKLYQDAINLSPQYLEFYFFREHLLIKKELYDDALETANKAFEASRNNFEKHFIYFDQSAILKLKHKFQEALASIDKAIETYQECAHCWAAKSDILAYMERYKEALRCANTAVELDSNNNRYWDLKANILYQLKKYEEALNSIDRAIELDSDNAMHYNSKAHMLLGMGKNEEALKSFNETLKIAIVTNDKVDASSSAFHIFDDYLGRAVLLAKEGDLRDAEEVLTKCIELKDYIDLENGRHRKTFEDMVLNHLSVLTQQGNWQNIELVLKSLKRLGSDFTDSLAPLSAAIQYIKTQDFDLIETLQKEVREVVISVVKRLSPDTPLPKSYR